MRKVIAILCGVSFGLSAMAVIGGMQIGSGNGNPARSVTIPNSVRESREIGPCPTEDSDNCYWIAETMGNGKGKSFVTIDGKTYYFRTTI